MVNKSPCIQRWRNEFGDGIEWKLVVRSKLQNQLEVKFAEFNSKILNNILATEYNLHKWKSQKTTCVKYVQKISKQSNTFYINVNVYKIYGLKLNILLASQCHDDC